MRLVACVLNNVCVRFLSSTLHICLYVCEALLFHHFLRIQRYLHEVKLFTYDLVPGRALPWLGEEGEYHNPISSPNHLLLNKGFFIACSQNTLH